MTRATARLRALVRALFSRGALERDLDREIRFHLEMLERRHLEEGMTPDQARRSARIELGGIEPTKERVREVRAARLLEETWQDLRHGARILRRNPGFAAVAVMTLALGVGACSAVFSLINGVVLHPFPYRDGDRLVLISSRAPGQDLIPLSLPDFEDLRQRSHSFDAIGAVYRWNPRLTGIGEPERLLAARVSAGVFPTLGLEPSLGRVLGAEEDRPGAEPVVVLSHAFWTRRFGASPDVLGRGLLLDGVRHTIVGVMPRRFELWTADLWAPIGLDPIHDHLMSRSVRPGLYAIGRPRPGIDLGQARAEVESIAAALKTEHPATNAGLDGSAVLWREQTSSELRPALMMLLGAVALVLAIAGANLTSLLLARFVTRERELGLRLALGAGRGRLLRQILAENLLVALLGAGGGLLLAGAALEGLASIFPFESTTAEARISIDRRVVLFAAVVALVSALLAGLVSATRSTFAGATPGFREGTGRISAGRAARRLTGLLVAGEIALSLALLIGAALLVQSFAHLRRASAGFDPVGLAAVSLQISETRYADTAARLGFYKRLLESARAQPGVGAAALTTDLPFGRLWRRADMTLMDRPEPAHPEEIATFDFAMVSDGFFETLRIPILSGRGFTSADGGSGALVVVVNEAARSRYWPDGDPIGATIRMGRPRALAAGAPPDREPPRFRIVGVAGDIKTAALEERAEPQLYVAFSQAAQLPPYALLGNVNAVVRSGLPATTILPALRRAVWAIDPEQPVSQGGTVPDLILKSQARRRLNTTILIVFGGLALLLSAVGLYGLTAHSVAQRAREMGIRMALGATPHEIRRLVLGRALRLAACGVGAGVLLTLALARTLSGLLFGVSPADPLTFVGVSIFLLVVAALAGYAPARKATRVDPVLALRSE